MILNTLLQEMSGPAKTLLHYTNFYNLISILDSGMLFVRDYPIGTHTDRKTPHRKELATIRPSRASTLDVSTLSDEAGGVKFIIHVHKLNDVIKGVKVAPIAEYPLSDINVLKNLIYKMDKKGNPLIQQRIKTETRKFNTFVKKVFVDFKSLIEMGHASIEKVDTVEFKTFKKLLMDTLNLSYTNTEVSTILQALKNYGEKLISREGEERISLRKGDGIPLDKRYMKIELEDGTINSINNIVDYEEEKLVKGIKKYQDLFVKNEEFDRVIEYLKNKKRI